MPLECLLVAAAGTAAVVTAAVVTAVVVVVVVGVVWQEGSLVPCRGRTGCWSGGGRRKRVFQVVRCRGGACGWDTLWGT